MDKKRLKVQLLLSFILLLATTSFQAPAIPVPDAPPDVCQQPENMLPNCNFNNGLDRWQSFTEEGGANFAVLQGGGECHAPLCPAAHIVVEGHFVGGLYQQVAAVKGNTYYANVVWLVFDSLSNDASIYNAVGGIGRRMGIDPFGGTDPRSPNVIWGAENWRNDCKICDGQEVTATAQADTITLFLRIDDKWKLRASEKGYPVPGSKDQFWIDDMGMKQVDGSVVPLAQPTEPPAPTDTPVPPPPTDTPALLPTDPPVSELPTDTPEPVTAMPVPSTEPSLEVAQAEASVAQRFISPVETPALVKAIAPPPTLTPTLPPLPTDTPTQQERLLLPAPTRRNRPTPEPELPVLSAGLLGVAGTTICAGGVVLLLMAAIVPGLIWLYRLGWGNIDDESDDDLSDREIIVEIIKE